MFIYNVSIKVNWAIHDAWLTWMKEVHIEAVMATKCFTHQQFVKLLDVDDEEGVTYAVQYYCATKANYEQYKAQYATQLKLESLNKWGNNFIGFRSFMQIVQ